MALFWTIMIAGFIILEAATTQLVCIWFAGGAFAALITAMCGLNPWFQTTVFVITAALLLIFTKQFVRKLKSKTPVKTNVDALIGQTAVVTEALSNLNSIGSVKVRGMIWSARSENGNDIKEGSLVTVKEIDGVKLIVINKEEE